MTSRIKIFRNFILPVAIMLFCGFTFGQNPILKDIGISDPHVRIFNDTIYLYSGHDADANDRTWVMKDWRIFSTTDLVNWTIRNTISPKENYMDDASSDCWAGDAATRNGTYFFYFSDRKRGVGVMTSDSPTGPFKDALGKPLVAPMHDPTLLVDDDKQKTPYLIYGDKEGGGFHIAKLNDDMISLAETPIPIQINGEAWENAPDWMDKNYMFKHKDVYYLSWGGDYAISKHIYGPYECVGTVGEGYKLGEFAHGSFFNWKGQFYHIWCRYIRDGYKFRESMITYCHIDDDGKIVTDVNFLDQHFSNGVGQYQASWEKIEAEWYYEITEKIQKTGSKDKGFILSNITNGAYVKFAKVNFDKVYKKMVMRIKFNGKKGKLEIRTGSPNGKRIGKMSLNFKNQSNQFQTVKFKIKAITGVEDIYIYFKGNKRNVLNLDWLSFE